MLNPSNDLGEELPLMDEYLIGPEDLTASMRNAWMLRKPREGGVSMMM